MLLTYVKDFSSKAAESPVKDCIITVRNHFAFFIATDLLRFLHTSLKLSDKLC